MAELKVVGSGLAELAENQEAIENLMLSSSANLAGHVRKAYDAAYFARSEITGRIDEARFERRRRYLPDQYEKLKASGSSTIHAGLGVHKANQITAYLRDLYFGQNEKIWDSSPTPVVELSQLVETAIEAQMQEEIEKFSRMMGTLPTAEMIQELRELLEKKHRERLNDEAKRLNDKQKTKFEDMFKEGDFYDALYGFLYDLSLYPNAFIQGPIVEQTKQLAWVQNQEGLWQPDLKYELKPKWYCLPPDTIFPAEGAKNVNHRYLTFIKRMTRRDLQKLKGTIGVNNEEIDKILQTHVLSQNLDWLGRYDTPEKKLEWLHPDAIIDVIIYQGDIAGSLLNDWMRAAKLEEEYDPYLDYNVEVYVIQDYAFKVRINFHPLGYKNLYTTSFNRITNSFWGESALDVLSSPRRMCNAAFRAIANNMGIASGPLTEVDVTRLIGEEDIKSIHPWQLFLTKPDMLGNNNPAIRFWQANPMADVLIAVFKFFSEYADEILGMPKYLTGAEPPAGAGRTATGLSMLLQQSSKFVKQVALNIDRDVLVPAVEYLHVYTMLFGDLAIKGDTNIVAKGAVVLAMKEANELRRTEFLQVTANEYDMQIMGLHGRANVLREVAKSLDIPEDKIIPPEAEMMLEKLQQEKEQELEVKQQQLQQGVLPEQAAKAGPTEPIGQVGSEEQLGDGTPVEDRFTPMNNLPQR